ncbi:MAG: rhodanese-like domain-containing protein [Caldilineaceae bacterium]|nr:rhodanese-like domain-containing protein [Caldilineaceae bacterium]
MDFARTNKRRTLLACCLLLLLVLSGCSGPTSSAPSPNADASAAPPLKLDPSVDAKTLAAVKDRADVLVFDVREQWEYDEKHIPGVQLIPMNTVPARLSEIPKDNEVIVTCLSGNRSGQVVEFLRQQGFTNVHNMTGGILAWEAAGYAVER